MQLSRLSGAREAATTLRGAAPRPALAARAPARTRLRVEAASGAAAANPGEGKGLLSGACALLGAAVLVPGTVGLAAPGELLTRVLGASPSPVHVSIAGAAIGVAWVYSAWLVSLKEAIDHDRLASDTYKRLSLGLVALPLAMLSVMARYTDVVPATLLKVACVMAALIVGLGSKLYAMGSGGASPLADAGKIGAGVGDGLKSLFAKPANAMSAVFAARAAIGLVPLLILLPTGLAPMFPAGIDRLGSYLVRVLAAGMLMTSITSFVLKDASDRGRLGASTFKLLNLAMAATQAQQTYYAYTLGSAGVELLVPGWRAVVGLGTFFTAAFAYSFLTSKK